MSMLEILLLNLLVWEKETPITTQEGNSKSIYLSGEDALFIQMLHTILLLETLVTEKKVIILDKSAMAIWGIYEYVKNN